MGIMDTSVAGVEKCSAVEEALSLFYLFIQEKYTSKEVELICNELKDIAGREDFQYNKLVSSKHTYTQVQDTLSKINEKQSIRKSKGVYYTPNDVVRFILINSIKAAFGKLTSSNISDMSLDNIPYRSFCCSKTVFDPTCGAGEYLLAALEIKIDLLKKKGKLTRRLVREAVSTIYGNDVNVESIIITELRLMLFILESCGVDYCSGLGNMQYILSFADRPDCLFDSVHQKLCILIGKDKKSEKDYYTGNYQYWYKQERCNLFSDIQMVKNQYGNADFIPKLGTEQDINIYKKITDARKMKSVYAASRDGCESVYLNRREAFWMKAYREKVDDPEYKVFSFKTPIEADFCYCMINSTLFWWYWISVSDCWHVSKDLNGFMMPRSRY